MSARKERDKRKDNCGKRGRKERKKNIAMDKNETENRDKMRYGNWTVK